MDDERITTLERRVAELEDAVRRLQQLMLPMESYGMTSPATRATKTEGD
jgi:hypothetical protein